MRSIQLLTFVVATILVASCDNTALSDVVRTEYADLTEANQDQLFERGWLPNILPSSTIQIVTANNLDLNTSTGEFTIDSEDFAKFQSQLRECMKSNIDMEELIEYGKKGYRPFCYKYDGSTWIFYINPISGHCRYQMQPTKKS